MSWPKAYVRLESGVIGYVEVTDINLERQVMSGSLFPTRALTEFPLDTVQSVNIETIELLHEKYGEAASLGDVPIFLDGFISEKKIAAYKKVTGND